MKLKAIILATGLINCIAFFSTGSGYDDYCDG